MHAQVLPLKASYPKARFILRHQVQPWHPSSTLVHEAALAVERLSPKGLLPFSVALMQRQKEYFDVSVVGETRNQTYGRLAKLAEETVGVSADAVLELLRIGEKPGTDWALNIGNKVRIHVYALAARLVLTGFR